MKKSTEPPPYTSERERKRFTPLSDLSITYEGRNEKIPVRGPDLTPHGMFINTPRQFPVGTVLKVSFRLSITDVQLSVRSEVRHCQAGIGIGVEFIGISPESRLAIEEEIHQGLRLRSASREK